MKNMTPRLNGFTLIELIMVIVILGMLTAFAIPKFADISSSAKENTLKKIAGAMESTVAIIRSVAFTNGITPVSSYPSDQSVYLVETEAGQFELDWRNLCPEARGEMGDALDMGQHLDLKEGNGLSVVLTNQYYRVGYDIRGTGPVTANGCYVTYDSFGDPICTIDVVLTDC